MLLGSMNRQMNLPTLQRIAMEFERENDIMDQRQEMMDEAIDEATGLEGEEEEGEDIVKEVLDEIGVDLSQAVRFPPLRVGLDEVYDADILLSWEKHPPIYKRQPWARRELRKRLELGVAVVRIRVMMTCRRDWIVCGGDVIHTTYDGMSIFICYNYIIYSLHFLLRGFYVSNGVRVIGFALFPSMSNLARYQ